MATVTWDDNWEDQPQDLSNPGRGADQIRKDKLAVRERVEVEHAFGENEQVAASKGGVHLEGSGRGWIEDDEVIDHEDIDRETDGTRIDPGTVSTYDLGGRTVTDLNKLSTLPEIDEAPIADTNILNRVRTIKCYDSEGTLLTVFDPDTFMSAILDQVGAAAITGIKEFTHRLWLNDTGYTDKTTYDSYTPGGADQLAAAKELLPRKEIDAQDIKSRETLICDPNDPENADYLSDGAFFETDAEMPVAEWPNQKRSVKDLTCRYFYADEMRANKFYGAVYTA